MPSLQTTKQRAYLPLLPNTTDCFQSQLKDQSRWKHLPGRGVSPICQTSALFPLSRASAVSVRNTFISVQELYEIFIILSYYLQKFLEVHRLWHSYHSNLECPTWLWILLPGAVFCNSEAQDRAVFMRNKTLGLPPHFPLCNLDPGSSICIALYYFGIN